MNEWTIARLAGAGAKLASVNHPCALAQFVCEPAQRLAALWLLSPTTTRRPFAAPTRAAIETGPPHPATSNMNYLRCPSTHLKWLRL
jgi:hypothetical protein